MIKTLKEQPTQNAVLIYYRLFGAIWLAPAWALRTDPPASCCELQLILTHSPSAFSAFSMASSPNGEDEFVHHVAIQLSRAMNLVNPNDLLARRVQDIAKNNSVDGFIEGAL